MNKSVYILQERKVAARRIGDELMIMSAHDSSLFSLNETAAILWNSADGSRSLADIVAGEICQEFDVDLDTALKDAREVVQGLANYGILKISEQPFTSEE